MRYPSARSKGFAALIWGVIALLAVSTVTAPHNIRVAVVAGSALVCALLLWIWFRTGYEFRDTCLFVQYGPFFERIPYERITGAIKLKSMASSMALSSDMIELRHGENAITGTTCISPLDQDGFLAELKTRCMNLK